MAKQADNYCLQIGMISPAIASVPFCRVLHRARLVPPFMAVWGLLGYCALLIGAVLDILGYSLGLTTTIPGGLFEVSLGILLIVKGIPEKQGSLALPA
ncbi:hypothetical protein JOF56_008735 [Kibdelosporangium banguiense]|uniref:DUF4386 domain-containing protein n=2 Tax=Kibdelosporangium banguiense TaxID=1365924 RepID=A0ABS4TVC2_9PSEU|nr:hypothetical protein [Kibdelosporangium banguiense]